MIKVNSLSIHNIDVENNNSDPLIIDHDKSDIDKYVNTLIADIQSSTRRQAYKFTTETEELPAALSRILMNIKDKIIFQEQGQILASRLLRVETKRQKEISQIKDLQKGSLIQVIGKDADKYVVIITKVEIDPYLDSTTLRYSTGLPVKKTRVQKSCVIKYSEDFEVEEIFISDTNQTIAKYWYDEFITAEPLTKAAKNSLYAYNKLDGIISREIKTVSPNDYWYLKNELNSYFSNQESFVFDDIKSKILNYKTDNLVVTKILKEKVTKKLEILSQNNNFDLHFEIDIEHIKSKIRRKIILGDNLELRFNAGIENLKHKIIPDVDQTGKFLKIYSDEGYDQFIELKNNEGN